MDSDGSGDAEVTRVLEELVKAGFEINTNGSRSFTVDWPEIVGVDKFIDRLIEIFNIEIPLTSNIRILPKIRIPHIRDRVAVIDKGKREILYYSESAMNYIPAEQRHRLESALTELSDYSFKP